MASDAAPNEDRITEIRIRGMRALDNVRLPLKGLTVLIGDNGTGKSTILEALEILYKAAHLPNAQFIDALLRVHGGLDELLGVGADRVGLQVRIEGKEGPIDYGFSLAKSGNNTIVAGEGLDWWILPEPSSPLSIVQRSPAGCRVYNPAADPSPKMQPVDLATDCLALTSFQALALNPAIDRVRRVLDRGSVHVPFDLGALWVAREDRRPLPMRESAGPASVGELDRRGANLVNAYHQLKEGSSREVWERILERVAIALDVTDIRVPPASDQRLQLKVRLRGMTKELPASSLSDGQLAYLAFVALTELGKSHAFVGFDEPEQHLHPGLLVRVTWLLEELAASCPVVLSTHSDRILDALSDPAASAVLCELDEQRRTRLLRPDAAALAKWLESYRGLGALREENATRHVFTEPVGIGVPAGTST